MPFDVAFSLPEDERMAYVIVLGILEGHVFDWTDFKWIVPSTSV